MKNYQYISTTNSTNVLLKQMLKTEKLSEFFVVRCGYQLAGRGQAGNSWESERGKNLLMSILLYPHQIEIESQFIISQMVSLAIVDALSEIKIQAQIKWPNDIYVGDNKIAGILIENSLRGSRIDYCIVGIGLNVNQLVFKSDAPNPVSLRQLLKSEQNIRKLTTTILDKLKQLYVVFDAETIQNRYFEFLYRNKGFYPFSLPNGRIFMAHIKAVQPDGALLLVNENSDKSTYYFKEIQFVIT